MDWRWVVGGGGGVKGVPGGGSGVGGLPERGRTGGRQKGGWVGRWAGRVGRTGPTGLENSPLFLLTLARCLIASYFRIFRVELSIETRERGFVCVLSPTALVVYSPRPLSLSPFFSLFPSCARPVPLLVFAHLIQLTHINPYSQKAWAVLVLP